jgi:hypothetical protein
VTVVDSQVAEKSLMERLGEKKQVIYSVEDLVTEFDLKLRNDYTGPTEFLVYGTVHPSKFSILSMSACAGCVSSFYRGDCGDFRFQQHSGAVDQQPWDSIRAAI